MSKMFITFLMFHKYTIMITTIITSFAKKFWFILFVIRLTVIC